MSEAFRAYYAIPRTIVSRDGRPINALIGFHNCLKKLFNTFEPEFCATAWSYGGPTFRHELLPEYKSHRTKPDLLTAQKELLEAYLRWLGIPQFSCRGLEADDVLATLANQLESGGYHVVLDTVDKDLLAMVSAMVNVWMPRSKTLWSCEQVVRKFGVPPSGLSDFLALMGDKADGIPRVSEFTRLEAIELIKKYGNLRVVLEERLSELPKLQKEKLDRNRNLIQRNLLLTHLRLDAPINTDPVLPSADQLRNALSLATDSLRSKDLAFLEPTTGLQGRLFA